MKILFTLVLFLSFNLNAQPHALVEGGFWAYENENYLVISLSHEKKWHTYWINPGDSGIATQFEFKHQNNTLKLEPLPWPVPQKYLEGSGDIQTYGYQDTIYFFFKAPTTANTILAKISYLICNDICIPGQNEIEIKNTFPKDQLSNLTKAFSNLPQAIKVPIDFEYQMIRIPDKELLELHYSLKLNTRPRFDDRDWLTPFLNPPFGFKREKRYWDEKNNTLHGVFQIEWDGAYQDPEVKLPINGVFDSPYNLNFLYQDPSTAKVSSLSLEVKYFTPSMKSVDEFYQTLTTLEQNSDTLPDSSSKKELSLLNLILFAFLGGLILNLMPCVLPVITLKIFGLIKYQKLPQKKIMLHNLSYTLGVVVTLLLLAGLIVILKSSGESIGWGFQLQSPGFVLIMVLILFILALNLFGLFEFRTPGGAKLGSIETKPSYTGDFLAGILTTILSTPCAAPFLGTALAFAFSTSNFNIFLIFTFIGIGLSFPFILTSFFPKSFLWLPKPGEWMNKIKYFLGLSLILTVIWLLDVLGGLIDFSTLGWKVHALLFMIFFTIFLYQKIKLKILSTLILSALLTYLGFDLYTHFQLRPVMSDQTVSTTQSDWIVWSEEKLQQLKGEWIFMDFTAAWCLTCKVNKKLVLDTKSFETFIQNKKIKLMRADWTKRDDHITNFLKKYQIVGVPAYFLQKPNGEIIFLGETITQRKIEDQM